jgi:hypothetical protein
MIRHFIRKIVREELGAALTERTRQQRGRAAGWARLEAALREGDSTDA